MKKQLKNVLALTMAVSMVFAVVGCSSNTQQATSAEGEQTAQTEQTAAESSEDVLIMATNAEFPPYESIKDRILWALMWKLPEQLPKVWEKS